ncbi:MAG: MFS transporter [Chloroflexi bacterium]|nr:MFS transporter [Chloroflexota bacterium]
MDKKRLYPILLIIFTNILGAGVIIPILPLYAEGTFQGTVPQITLLASAFFGAQFIAAPWLGRLSDRYGRRPILILSQVGTVAAFVLFIYAGQLGALLDQLGLNLPLTGGMAMLFVARLLDGITGGNITIAQAYISDITPDDQRAQGLGLLQAAFGAGFVFGPAFGGILGNYGLVLPFIGATVVTVITLLLTIFTLKESLPPEERSSGNREERARVKLPMRLIFSDKALVLILAVGFVSSLAFAALPATFALYANHVIFAEAANPGRIQLYIGLMLAFNGATQVLTQIVFLRPLVARFGERNLLILGQASIAVSLFGLAIAGSPLIATLFLAPFAFGFGVGEPNTQSLVTRFGSRRSRGFLLGLYQSARSLALIAGPIWAGYIYEAINPRSVYAIGGATTLLAFVGAILLKNMPVKEIEVPEISQSSDAA